ncbi:hypothetical protein G6F57_023468 [Rhizopus arrhizus]|nr:hypothetical protein G6F57_023468 [Rhizopus arrhizus]
MARGCTRWTSGAICWPGAPWHRPTSGLPGWRGIWRSGTGTPCIRKWAAGRGRASPAWLPRNYSMRKAVGIGRFAACCSPRTIWGSCLAEKSPPTPVTSAPRAC